MENKISSTWFITGAFLALGGASTIAFFGIFLASHPLMFLGLGWLFPVLRPMYFPMIALLILSCVLAIIALRNRRHDHSIIIVLPILALLLAGTAAVGVLFAGFAALLFVAAVR
jgi:hypothetical protein